MKKLALSLLATLALLTACAADDPAADVEADTANVTIRDNEFSPSTITIKAGQIVRWTWNSNGGGLGHNVVSGAACGEPDNKFDGSGAPKEGGTYEYKFEVAGTFPYYCEPHCSMGMKGTVVVQ